VSWLVRSLFVLVPSLLCNLFCPTLFFMFCCVLFLCITINVTINLRLARSPVWLCFCPLLLCLVLFFNVLVCSVPLYFVRVLFSFALFCSALFCSALFHHIPYFGHVCPVMLWPVRVYFMHGFDPSFCFAAFYFLSRHSFLPAVLCFASSCSISPVLPCLVMFCFVFLSFILLVPFDYVMFWSFCFCFHFVWFALFVRFCFIFCVVLCCVGWGGVCWVTWC
jgi:hypothetical protein